MNFLYLLEGCVEKKLQKSICLWLTGLPGSGKSTIAEDLNNYFTESDYKSYVLDGDKVRSGLSADLSFTDVDRKENIRRIAEVCNMMMDAGMIVIVAVISPKEDLREFAREIVGEERFYEVYLSTPLETCIQRDPKGHYKKALAGEINGFTGVSAPFEPSKNARLRLDTSDKSVEECSKIILDDINLA